MRNWRSNRILFLGVCLAIALTLIGTSQAGFLAPIKSIIVAPLNFVTGLFNKSTLDTVKIADMSSDVPTLQKRVADLEEALARYQSELVELREVANDYQRLSELVNYTAQTQNQEFLAADVISNADSNAPLQTISINKGTRDGITIGMPVVSQLGLIGRVLDVTANASRVLLITDVSSAISGRLQTTRDEGSIVGQASNDLRMEFIPLNAKVQEGDIVITSGLGGNLPAGIVIGQVTSVQQREFELFQNAVVRSLNNFATLETVLVITNFQPVDLSVFEQSTQTAPGS
ncbi:MAG: rod shape-determining protein MreC [Anaerolineaceae bacterium]|nr:rod shape-determining protein MreC [Anaerolineaceae bacterium]